MPPVPSSDRPVRAPRLRVIARDPETLYAYWEGVAPTGESPWELRAEGPGGVTLASVTTTAEQGWLSVAVASVSRVSVRPLGAQAPSLSTVLVTSGPVPPMPTPLPSSSSALLRAS